MSKKFKNMSIDNFIWLVMMFLPFIVVFIFALSNRGAANRITLDSFIDSMYNMLHIDNPDNLIFSVMSSVSEFFLGSNNSNHFYYLLFDWLTWYFITLIMHLCFDVITFLINCGIEFIEKGLGDKL